jgi:5'-nucleotidase/UDP-sugar diphosphatase
VRVTADPAQSDYVPENATLKSTITDPLVAYKAGLAANVIGTSEVLLDGGNPNPIRQRESNLGNLVADGFLAAVNRTAVADGRPVAKVAFSNGGGIRTSIAAGNITDSYPFNGLPQVAAGVPYQQSLYDYIVTDLGGAVTAARYPLNSTARITITP